MEVIATKIDKYLNKTEPHLRNIRIGLQSSDTWKIQLTIAINFISSRDAKEQPVMHSRRDNIKFTSYNEVNDVINKLFDSPCSKYQRNLETSMRGSDFIFDSVQLMCCKFYKVNFRHGGSCIDSLDRLKKKKATINSKNEDAKYFQYAVTVALNYGEI